MRFLLIFLLLTVSCSREMPVRSPIRKDIINIPPLFQKEIKPKETLIQDQKLSLIWPAKGTISSGYGVRQGKMHHGIDITKDNGKNIVAAMSGFIEFSGRNGGFGNLIIIDHGNGVKTYYAHCSKLFAMKNSKVKQGQLIAKMGATGKVNGPHLHFEIRVNGKSKNPLKYLTVR